MDRSNKIWLGIAVFFGVTAFLWLLTPKAEPVLVEAQLPERLKDSLPEAPIAKRFRHVELSPAAVDAVREGERIIQLNLFPGETVRVRLDKAEKTDPVSTEVHGEVDDVMEPAASLPVVHDAIDVVNQQPT